MQQSAAARIKVFWQPGCTSCLRVKEFLSAQGIQYESVNVHGNPRAMAELDALGARSVPVVALAGRYTLAQSMRDVVKFLDLKTKVMESLPPAQLVGKLDIVLAAAVRFTRQFSEAELKSVFRNRNRTVGALAFHVFRIAELGVQASRQIELRFEAFDDLPPQAWGGEQIAAWGESMRQTVLEWWKEEQDRSLAYSVPTYYGARAMHEVLERTTWHAAQHTRQLMLILQTYGKKPDRPLKEADLAGLPVPDEVWDR